MRGSHRLLMAMAVASLVTTVAAPPASAGGPTFAQRAMLGSDLFVTDENSDFWINAVAPADIDDDLDLDLAVIGFHVVYFESVEEILVVFHNEGPTEGGWLFSEQRVPIGDVTAGASDLAWGDYDNDGDLDILVAGNIQEEDGTFNTVLRTYRNDGGTFTPTTLIDAPNADWLDLHAATWADYDSDGDMDLLVTGNFVGESEIEGKSEIYGNDAGTFTALGVELPAPIQSIGRGGAFTWFDLDNDRDLDYLVAGAYFVPDGGGLVEAQINLFENEAGSVNLAPTAPGDLTAGLTPDGIALDWTAASDDSTPQQALTYDLELHRAGQGFGPAKRDPAPGALGAVDDWEMTDLGPGRYVWSVRAVDSAYNAGPRASGTLTVPAATAGLAVAAAPVEPPIVVPATGGSFRYRVAVRNTTDTWKAFELSVIVRKPGGGVRTVSRLTGSVAAGETFRTTLIQRVPGEFPPGQYAQIVSLQRRPTPATSDGFTWVKESE